MTFITPYLDIPDCLAGCFLACLRAKAREQAALAQAMAAREAVFDRLQWQLAELRASLERAAVANAAMAAEFGGQVAL